LAKKYNGQKIQWPKHTLAKKYNGQKKKTLLSTTLETEDRTRTPQKNESE